MENNKEELNENQIASKGKIFLSSILDFTVHMFLLLIIFGFCAAPLISVAGYYDPYKNASTEFFKYIEDTHLFTFEDDGKPINSRIESSNYIGKLVKTTYFIENKEFKSLVNGVEEVQTLSEKDTIYYQKDGKYINDNLAYYFFNFRESSQCDIPNEIKNDVHGYKSKADYFYSEFLNLKEADNRYYFNQEIFSDGHVLEYVSGKSLLDVKNAELLHDYIFLNKASEKAEEVYSKLDRMYHNAANKSFEELDKYSLIYKGKYQSLINAEGTIYAAQLVALVLAYLVSFTLYFVLLPLLLKENRTLGLRFNHLLYTTARDKKPQAKHIIVKDCILFFTQGISMIFPILFLGNSNLLYMKFGWFRFVYIILFLALLSLASIIMAAWGKKHQFLCEYTANLVTKDTDSLKVSKEHEVIE